MMEGEVTAQREAVVSLKLHGKNGLEIIINAVIDTGFTDNLTLPSSIINECGYPFVMTGDAQLADGGIIEFNIHRATILWNGELRKVLVHAAECTSLLGMSLLYGSLVTLHVVDGGQVTIQPDFMDS